MKELYKIQAEKDDGTLIEIEVDIEELSKTMTPEEIGKHVIDLLINHDEVQH